MNTVATTTPPPTTGTSAQPTVTPKIIEPPPIVTWYNVTLGTVINHGTGTVQVGGKLVQYTWPGGGSGLAWQTETTTEFL